MDGNPINYSIMKKLKYIFILLVLLTSCQNKDLTFPDYKYNGVYFPLQYPLRTLVLGDSRSDNSLDKNLQFHIGVSIGGMYENKKSWNVEYMLDTTLVPSNLTTSAGDTLKVLPPAYFTLSPLNNVIIPAGSFDGLILVQLTDAFLDDPLAVKGDYVIPLRITGSTADSILRGVPAVSNPNKNIASDWDASASPKDFVLFGIKYINPYHGSYFHRGKDITLSAAGDTLSTVVYHQRYVENDQLWKLTTTGRTTVETNGVGSQFSSNTELTLDIDSSGTINVKPVTTSALQAKGVGKYVKNSEIWGGTKNNAMYLNYIYKNGTLNHVVTDTLVFRDNGVVFEQFSVKLN